VVRCQLTGGGAKLPSSYFHGPTATPVSTAVIELTGRVDLAKAGSATVECFHTDFFDT
jgi:hypothetical protein